MISLHRSPIAAAHDAQMRDERQPHQAIGLSFDDPRVDHFDLVVSNPVDLQTHAPATSAVAPCSPVALLAGPLGHAHQQNDLAIDHDRAGIEHPDDLEIIAQRREIGRAQEQSFELTFQEHERLLPRVGDHTQDSGQPIRGTGGGERVSTVFLGDLPHVGTIANPGDLVGHERRSSSPYRMRLVGALAPGKLDGLIDIERVCREPGRRDPWANRLAETSSLAPGNRSQSARVWASSTIAWMRTCVGTQSYKRHIAPFEDQPQLLPVHPAGLVEAVIEVDEDRRAVAHGAMDVLLDGR